MGAISFTIDPDLLRELKRLLPLELFVETGTFRGDTLEAARTFFTECISIELSPEYYAAASARFAARPNLRLLLGDSPAMLREHRALYAGRSTLFWLDAHWCAAEGTAGEVSQCPLLGELEAIASLHPQSVILIDDARLFLSPPPRPHEISSWPDWEMVARQLRRLGEGHALVCYNDILVFAPAATLASLRPFLHEHAVNLLTLADKARDYDSVLAQAEQKDDEIRDLAEQAGQKDDEIRRLTDDCAAHQVALNEKEMEIGRIHTAAVERLEIIQRCEREIARLGGSSADRTATTPIEQQVATLRTQLAQARRQLQTANETVRKLERAAQARVPGRPEGGLAQRWSEFRNDWLSRLAAGSPHPLAQLKQYAPRPLRLEKFPRPTRPLSWPRICVVTPSYQQAHFLEATMASVLDQGYPNLAYGVQDGGSTDGSAEIITRYLPRLAHAESAADQGQADAIRKGFARLYPKPDDLMAWLNSDDLLMPGALRYVGEYFARHPTVDVVYGHRVIINEPGEEIARWFLPRHHAGSLQWFDLVPQETLFFRARCYQEVGGIDESFQFALDWDLLLRFEAAGCVIRRLPYFLGCFRAHDRQKTSAKIHTVGESEMKRLRRRVHDREVPVAEIQRHFTEEINRSAIVERLHRFGVRY